MAQPILYLYLTDFMTGYKLYAHLRASKLIMSQVPSEFFKNRKKYQKNKTSVNKQLKSFERFKSIKFAIIY